jgi:D-alanine-D-alanine ligase
LSFLQGKERMKKRIGLVYDLRSDYLALGYCESDVAEFDSEDTINALHQTIESLGYAVERIGNGWALCRALAAGKRWDLVFTIAEGLTGRSREAQVPAILELYQIPYTFSDPLVCAATLDKAVAKKLVAAEGLPTAGFAVVRCAGDLASVNLAYPLFAKPLAEGTGKGIDQHSKIENPKQLQKICKHLLDSYHQPVLVETYLSGREFTVGIVGSGPKARVIGTMEIEVAAEGEPAIYSYLNKEECETRIRYSALREPAIKQAVESLALGCYQVLECRDGGRVDIRCDGHGKPFFLEVNPLAGLHPTHSDLPMIATQEGMKYEELIDAILRSALERAAQEQKADGKRARIV